MTRPTWMLSAAPLLAAATWTAAARAQEVPPSPVVPVEPVAPAQSRSETVTERGGPSVGELTSGIATLGVTYGAAAIAAASSPQVADHRMFVPVAARQQGPLAAPRRLIRCSSWPTASARRSARCSSSARS